MPGRLFGLRAEAASVVMGLNRGEKDGKYIGVPRFLSRSGKKVHLVVLYTNGVQEKLFALGPEECVRWELSSRMSRRS